MSDDIPENKPKPKSPSRRSFLTGFFDAFSDGEKMAKAGGEAGKAYRELKGIAGELHTAGKDVEETVAGAVEEVHAVLDPPAIAPALYAAAERGIDELEQQLAPSAAEDPPVLGRDSDPAETQALLHEIVDRLRQIEDAVGIQPKSPLARDQAEANRWAKLRERLYVLLAGAGGALATKSAEALYEGWVQENVWPLLPDWVRHPWEAAVSAQGAQPASPLSPVSPLSPLATPTNEPYPTPAASQPASPVRSPEPGTVGDQMDGISVPELAHVPSGWFWMGSDKTRDAKADDDEMPQCWLWLPGYWIGKYPVTNVQYLAFVRATDHKLPGSWINAQIPSGKTNHPVADVSWRDAKAYCRWLTTVTGLLYRLPTEAEWEKAARGADGRIWPWGDDRPTKEHCNFSWNVKGTTPVGLYPLGTSPYGIMDMSGNVWEWTCSLYKPYPYDAADGREDDNEETDRRVLRGGSWNSYDSDVRAAYRYGFDPDLWFVNGFRCVCSQWF